MCPDDFIVGTVWETKVPYIISDKRRVASRSWLIHPAPHEKPKIRRACRPQRSTPCRPSYSSTLSPLSTDELESLHAELHQLRQKTLERAKKAGDDLETVEESLLQAKDEVKDRLGAQTIYGS